MSIGIILLLISTQFNGPEFTWLSNFGTEFIGGVIVLIAFSALESRSRIRKGINYNEFSARIRTTKKELRILTTFTYLFAEDEHIPKKLHVGSLSVAKNELVNKIRLNPELAIQVLVLDPLSEGAKQRCQDRTNADVLACINSNIEYLWLLKNQFPSPTFEVRVYNALPRLSLFQWDELISISFFERDRSISESPRTEVSASNPLGHFVLSAFDDLWHDKHTVTLEQFMEGRGES